MISLWTFSGLVGGEVGGSLHHQLSGFSLSGGEVSVLVGSIQLTLPGGGFSISKQCRDIFGYMPW